jgi:hypothetical protein
MSTIPVLLSHWREPNKMDYWFTLKQALYLFDQKVKSEYKEYDEY